MTGDCFKEKNKKAASYEDGIYEMTDGRTERECGSGKRCLYRLEAGRCGAGECAGRPASTNSDITSLQRFSFLVMMLLTGQPFYFRKDIQTDPES